MYFCKVCNVKVLKYSSHKRSNIHKANCLLSTEFNDVHVISCAFKNRIISYRIDCKDGGIEPEFFLNNISVTVKQLINRNLEIHKAIKINFELYASYVLPKNDEKSLKSFNTSYVTTFANTDIMSMYFESCKNLAGKLTEFELAESGWTLESISHLEINIAKYNPLRAGSYISLPKKIQNTKSCLNIKNEDDHCFLWSVVAHMFPSKRNPNRVSSYPHYSQILNINDMSFPPSFHDIKLFEENNPTISVNVYGLGNNNDVNGPLYKTQKRKMTHVNLLYINQNEKRHFCLIKSFEKLVHKQITRHRSKIFLCDECFVYFDSEDKLDKHSCARVKTVLPEEGKKLHFNNYERKQRIPVVIYGDFESLLKEYDDKNKASHTENIQMHQATSFAYYICSESKPELNEYVSYRGPNCAKIFVETISNDLLRLNTILSKDEPMQPLTDVELKSFQRATSCHICEKTFCENDKVVTDHDHFTGLYKGPAHNSCNLNAKKCVFIPVIFHNLSNYDCHLFITELGNVCGRINIIPKTKEKYISFTKFIPIDSQKAAQLKFIDSFNFLSSSLDKLVKTLHPNDFKNLRNYFVSKDEFDLVRRKGVYCYDYVDSMKRYEETELPPRSNFFNKLTSEHISEQEYEHAQKVWETFKINNLGEYTDLYLKCDVLLLADVFEKFRNISLCHYQLDPCYYVSSPALSWDAMLLYTEVELDLISDVEIYQMLEKGIRGGLAQCSLRYAQANNKYMLQYNDNEPSSFMVYLDCVNLYGFAMMQKLPKSNFSFLNLNQVQNFDVTTIPDDSDHGYILEVDLHYPADVHDQHSDLPFAPEKFAPIGKTTPKLIANLYDKYRYVIHYVHLKKCLEHGLRLLKIHRVLCFDQSNFLEPYISLNTSLRQQAQSDFEKDFFKKQNNSIFGKTIENKRQQVDVKLVNVWFDDSNKTNKLIGAEKYISAPNFKCLSIFSENLVAIQLDQSTITLDRPIYIGFSVLELAKTHLYNFHYSVMKTLYKDNIQLCYTDTDSLLYRIFTDDFYADMKKNIRYFDTSNFESNNVFNIPKANAKIPGYFKDEMGGDIITEFVGLRAKLYCVNSQKVSIKKAKGVKSSVTKKLDIEKYKKALFENESLRENMCIIRSCKHKIFTQNVNKLVLNNEDDKRQVKRGCVSTFPWGHYNTMF